MSYSVSLDGVSLDSVSSYVHIYDVIELQPGRTTTTRERLRAPGSIITRDHLASKPVRVQFALLTDILEERTKALSDIAAWAMQGKYLTISDRPGQQLRVVCTDSPVTMSKRKWTDLCEMTFTAFTLPFWEDVEAYGTVSISFADATTEWTVYPRTGNVRETPLCLSITPEEKTLTAVKIIVNGTEMAFSGLAVPAGNSLTISYPDGYLVAKYTDADGNEVHCLANRTGAEYLPVITRQENPLTFWADARVKFSALTRGWYW